MELSGSDWADQYVMDLHSALIWINSLHTKSFEQKKESETERNMSVLMAASAEEAKACGRRSSDIKQQIIATKEPK